MINKLFKSVIACLLVMVVFAPFSLVHAQEEYCEDDICYGEFLGETVPIYEINPDINYYAETLGSYTYNNFYYIDYNSPELFLGGSISNNKIVGFETTIILPTAITSGNYYDIDITWSYSGFSLDQTRNGGITFYDSSYKSLYYDSASKFDWGVKSGNQLYLDINNMSFSYSETIKYIKVVYYVVPSSATMTYRPTNITIKNLGSSGSGGTTGGGTTGGGTTGGSTSGSTDVSYIESLLESLLDLISEQTQTITHAIEFHIGNLKTALVEKFDALISSFTGTGESEEDVTANDEKKDEFNETANQYNDLESSFQNNMNDSLNSIDTSNTIITGNDFIKTANFISVNMHKIVTSNNVYNSYVSSALILGLALILIGKRVI